MADRLVEALLEHLPQPRALERIVEARIERVDVGGQLALAPQVVPGVLVAGEHVLGIELEPLGQRFQEHRSLRRRCAVVDAFIGEQRGVVPYRLAVLSPEARQRPARQLLTRIPLALPEVQQTLGRIARFQLLQQGEAEAALVRPDRFGVPLVAVAVVERHEGRLAAHRQAHVVRGEVGVDAMPEAFDRTPLQFGVGLGDARRLAHALDAHLVHELDLAFLREAGERRGARRLGRAGERDMAFAREQPRGRVEADPARARQIGLAPGMQVGEIGARPRRAVERLHVRRELHQIAGNEARRDAEVAQDLHQQPARVAARAAAERDGFLRRLHAGLHADQVAHVPCDLLVELHQEVVGPLRRARDLVEPGLEERRERQAREIRRELDLLPRLVLEGELLGVRLEEEIERIDDRHLGHQIHLDRQLARLLLEHEAR